MNSRTLIQSVAAIVLLTASQPVLANFEANLEANLGVNEANARVAGLDAAVRTLYLEAHSTIQADIRANIKATPIIIDEPGVTTGKIEIVAEVDTGNEDGAGEGSMASAAQLPSREIRLDILNKALATPGLFGVYRYVTATAKAAVIVVK